MKRIIPILLTLIFLSGCTVKDYTPELPVAFKQNASVSLGDFSFKCEICKNSSSVKATILDTNAKDMVMLYNGDELEFVFGDYNYSIGTNNFEKTNVAIVVYQVMECAQSDNVVVKKTEGGYQYRGRVDAGDFVLMLNDDNTLKSIVIQNTSIKIMFE